MSRQKSRSEGVKQPETHIYQQTEVLFQCFTVPFHPSDQGKQAVKQQKVFHPDKRAGQGGCFTVPIKGGKGETPFPSQATFGFGDVARLVAAFPGAEEVAPPAIGNAFKPQVEWVQRWNGWAKVLEEDRATRGQDRLGRRSRRDHEVEGAGLWTA